MNDEEETKKALENLDPEPTNNMPEGLEVFEPKNEGRIKNINQQDGEKQFVAKDIGYSQNTEEKKNERYTGPVTQAHYDNGEMSQSFNSSNTVVHKSHATRNKKLILVLLILVIAAVAGAGYYLSTQDTSTNSSQVSLNSQESNTEAVFDQSSEAKKERDSVRKTDINTIYQKLEEYYNVNGFYPTVIDTATFSDASTETLADPSGVFMVSEAPQAEPTPSPVSPYASDTNPSAGQSQYTYQPYSCASTVEGTHCSKYILSSWQELVSGPYEKFSLN